MVLLRREESAGDRVVVFDNSQQFRRICYRFRSYLRIGIAALRRGVSLHSMLVTKFPYWFKDLSVPSSLSVEFTDACNLRCVYCNNPGFANPRTFMSDEIFEHLVASLGGVRVPRIRVGGGEPTLHPQFAEFSRRLARQTPFLSIVTNAQWRSPKAIVEALLTEYQLIEISIDAGGAAQYESSRQGGNYQTLVDNIVRLSERRRTSQSKALINIRLMIRPSTAGAVQSEKRMWSSYCDTIMPQYVLKGPETSYRDDVYHTPHALEDEFPRCTLPFKDLQVRSNGDVPLCQVTGSATDQTKKVIIGNVRRDSIAGLWHSDALRRIRRAHRRRVYDDMRVCQGCNGR